MGFFTTSVTGLKTVVTAIGAGVGVWGVINLLEGYGNDNPGANAHVRKVTHNNLIGSSSPIPSARYSYF